jgi:hypothetical protein
MRRIQSRELPQQSLRGNNVVQPLELATGFEPRIIQQGKKVTVHPPLAQKQQAAKVPYFPSRF